MAERNGRGAPSRRPAAHRRGAVVLAAALVGAVALLAQAPAPAASVGTTPPEPPDGRSQLVQDATWLALKDAHRIGIRDGAPVVLDAAPLPSSLPTRRVLPTSVAERIVEAPPYGVDAAGRAYVDGYYANFCGAGATEVALIYWGAPVTTFPAGLYVEPLGAAFRQATYWTSNGGGVLGRSFEMYLAMAVQPPSFPSPGEVTFPAYPFARTGVVDIRDTLNWEASGENPSGWAEYYYAIRSSTDTSLAVLQADVAHDVNAGVPVVAAVDARLLPNWSTAASIPHAITIVGYDDARSLYYYTDTCGTRCGSSHDGGVNAISQSGMLAAIKALRGRGYVW